MSGRTSRIEEDDVTKVLSVIVAFVVVGLVGAGSAVVDEAPIAGTVKAIDASAKTLTLQTTAEPAPTRPTTTNATITDNTLVTTSSSIRLVRPLIGLPPLPLVRHGTAIERRTRGPTPGQARASRHTRASACRRARSQASDRRPRAARHS